MRVVKTDKGRDVLDSFSVKGETLQEAVYIALSINFFPIHAPTQPSVTDCECVSGLVSTKRGTKSDQICLP